MLNINGWEFAIIAVLFIVLFGPERIPEVAAQVGKVLAEIRQLTEGATSELTRELELAARQGAESPARPTPEVPEPSRAEPPTEEGPATEGEPAGEADGQDSASPPAPSIFRGGSSSAGWDAGRRHEGPDAGGGS